MPAETREAAGLEPAAEGRGTRVLNLRRMTARRTDEAYRSSTPLELFFDLCFVAAVAQAASHLHHDLSGGHLGHAVGNYLWVFFAIWWAWGNFTWFASAYDNDDDAYRLLTMVQIAGALTLAAGVPRAFESGDYLVITLGYVILRLAMVMQWLRAARADPERRTTTLRYAVGYALVQAGWVARLAFDQPTYLFVGLALAVGELLVPIWAERAQVTTFHPDHITERFGLFTMIVLGEAVLAATVAVQTAADSRDGTDVDLLVLAGSGLLLVFSLWWLYFDRTTQRMLRSMPTTIIWGYGHYLVFASTAAIGAGLAVAVDALIGHARVTHLQQGLAVGIPLAAWIATVRWLRVGPPLRGPAVAASPMAAVLVLAAAWTSAAVPLMAVITAALAAVTTWAARRTD
ncbi:low temperature requirement protein A [Streptomyces sp. RLB1-33]|uniref:low temperature requirement protein A n=1 Tax=Streptomyces mirabilis TaxID=68239 RepID=UPI00143E43FA|nr:MULTISPECIES: low temperature requirement protein A [Streptomyces]QIY72374.1 low temperature requirement protein A [Streptomyces sp. RLB1-33]